MPPSKIKCASGSGIPAASAFNTFKVVKPKGKTRERAKFDPTRRREVKEVRKIRACLRCSLLKIRCSPGDLCTTCKDLVLHAHEKLILSFSGCIRTRLVEVSVFEDAMPPIETQDSVLIKIGNLPLKSITLTFASRITWNLPALVDDIVDWLSSPQVSTRSKVGTLSSPNFVELVEQYVGFENTLNFQRMLYAESLAYTQATTKDQHHLSVDELQQIGAFAGHNFLRFLDDKLRPQSLTQCSKDDLHALFLLVVGTILAVGYTEPAVHAYDSTKKESDNGVRVHEAQLQAMQDHLCQILAHYVLYLGSQLSLPIATHIEQFILEAAAARWYKEGNFEWLNTPTDQSKLTISPDVWPAPPMDALDPFSDPQIGDPSLLSDNDGQNAFDSPLAIESLKSTSGLSQGQDTRSGSSFGVVENPKGVLYNLFNIGRQLGTVSVSEVVRNSFDYWTAKWVGKYRYGSRMAACHGPVPWYSSGGANFSLTTARLPKVFPVLSSF